jgi:hypothetical protein
VFRHLYRIQIAGRGGFTPGRGGHFTAASGDPHNKTLLIIKIPPQQNDIATIDTHFKQFGTITNIKVCHNNQPDQALITFADRWELMCRFVKFTLHSLQICCHSDA